METNLKEQLKHFPIKDGVLDKIISLGKKETNQTILIHLEEQSVSLNFMNLGYQTSFTLEHLTELFQRFGRQLEEDSQILLDGMEFAGYSVQQVTEAIIKGMLYGAYSFLPKALTQVSNQPIFSFREQLIEDKAEKTVTLISSKDLERSIDKAVNYGKCINYARMLGDIPNNYLHVKQFAEYAEDLAKEYHLKCEILGQSALEAFHCGGILGVNGAGQEEAGLITIYYEGSKEAPVTALIGKGVMFDSGGYHLKGINEMEGMKYDMCGAANMLAALEIAVRERSKANILLVIPAVENVIGPMGCKMGDVLTTMSGKTVEVYNTDAEGRLILCDAITYAIKKGADRIIDLATLTYSCQKALGNKISGAFSNDDDFYMEFYQKTKEQCEKIWRLPLDYDYHKQLYHTQTADLINYVPGSEGGASIAACFLEEFVEENILWIHLDIVGPAVNREKSLGKAIGATGVLTASIAAF